MDEHDAGRLTPEELVTQADGEHLLRQLSKSQPAKILGADGRPVESIAKVSAPAGQGVPLVDAAKAVAGQIEEWQRAAQKELEASVAAAQVDKLRELQEVSELLDKVVADSPEASELLVGVMLTAHRLIHWAKLELELLDERITPRETYYAEAMMQQKAYQGGGFFLQDLLAVLRHKTLKILERAQQRYGAVKRVRRMQLKPLYKRIGRAGISLPCESLRKLFQKRPFFDGILVLHGRPEAVRAALALCIRFHYSEDGGSSFYLAQSPTDIVACVTEMPASWWGNCAKSLFKLHEILRPVTDSSSALVCVDNVAAMLDESGGQRQAWQKYGQILSCLQQWALENSVAVIAGDYSEKPDERLYGGLPRCAVSLQEKEGKKWLVLGGDAFAQP